MNKNIIDMLEAIKYDKYTNAEDYLTSEEILGIKNWYKKYTFANNTNTDLQKIIDLMYVLYIRENIDIYPRDMYHKFVDNLSEDYSFPSNAFQYLLADFHKIVYDNITNFPGYYQESFQTSDANNKFVIVINGRGGVGKDALCDVASKKFKIRNVSAIMPIKEIALAYGWTGSKDTKSRKFLADLKRAFADYNDLPNNYLLKEYYEFLFDDNQILFAHIRESDQIDKFLSAIRIPYATLLIQRTSIDSQTEFGNDADDCVDNYHYDYIFNNDESLDICGTRFINLINDIISNLRLVYA